MAALPKPEPFLEVRVHDTALKPTLCGLCVGYESGKWRAEQLANHIVEWIPEFALPAEEFQSLNHANALSFIRRAAKTVYETKKFEKRGEFGELFLHAIIRQIHDSLPAISKIFYKSATNDTVKGFDAVHVVGSAHDMELWLGEAKFYDSITSAIRDVVKELEVHFAADYLRTEFMLIKGKIDDSWVDAEALKKLLSPNTSLDDVFSRVCIPVFLTYDSPCLAGHSNCSVEYIKAFKSEIQGHYQSFLKKLAGKAIPSELRVHLFLMPLNTKTLLVDALDRKLKAWQSL